MSCNQGTYLKVRCGLTIEILKLGSIFPSTVTLLKVWSDWLIDPWLTHWMSQPITTDTGISRENFGNLTLVSFFKNHLYVTPTSMPSMSLTFDEKC